MARVLIAGCGDVGTAIGLRLVADGHEVFGLRRHPDRLPTAIRPLAGDLADPASLGALPSDVELVAYTAAADGFDDDAYRRAYVVGVANLLRALRERHATVRRLLFTSSTAVYGQADGSWVDEASPTEPAGFSGRRVLEGEQLVLRSGVPAAVLRLAGIYGPGRTRLIERVRSGAATCPDEPRWTNRIHRDDCAGAAHHLLTVPDPDPLWLGVDHEPAEECPVLDWIAARLGAPPPRRVPRGTAMGRPATSKRCSNRKLVASGYVFRYPTFREGYAALL